jgi:hypothetical protein
MEGERKKKKNKNKIKIRKLKKLESGRLREKAKKGNHHLSNY